MCRSAAQVDEMKFKNGIEEQLLVYKITRDAAGDGNGSAATERTKSRTGTHNSKKDLIWKNQIFGEEWDDYTELAHLVPASPFNANTYWFVTDFLFGYEEKEREWAVRSKLIHGTQKIW